jgi:hypothetical protein
MSDRDEIETSRRNRIEILRHEREALVRIVASDRAVVQRTLATYPAPVTDAEDVAACDLDLVFTVLPTIRDVIRMVALVGGTLVRKTLGIHLNDFVTFTVVQVAKNPSPVGIRVALNGINLVEAIGYNAGPVILDHARRWATEANVPGLTMLEQRQRCLVALALDVEVGPAGLAVSDDEGAELHAVFDRLMVIMQAGAPYSDALPLWHEVLLSLPPGKSYIDVGTALWIARLIHCRLGRHPVETVGDFFKQGLDDLLDRPAP